MQKWYLGSMNDGLFIINQPPRPSTDEQFHEREDGPSMVLNVSGIDPQLAYEIVSAHNLSLAEQRLEADRLRSRIMELEKALASRVGSRSGPAMTAVVAALHERPDHEWTTAEVLASAPAFVSKQIYNALGYLVRHGRLNKSGYGRYRLPADRVLTEGRK